MYRCASEKSDRSQRHGKPKPCTHGDCRWILSDKYCYVYGMPFSDDSSDVNTCGDIIKEFMRMNVNMAKSRGGSADRLFIGDYSKINFAPCTKAMIMREYASRFI